jgi:hypothetical protein
MILVSLVFDSPHKLAEGMFQTLAEQNGILRPRRHLSITQLAPVQIEQGDPQFAGQPPVTVEGVYRPGIICHSSAPTKKDRAVTSLARPVEVTLVSGVTVVIAVVAVVAGINRPIQPVGNFRIAVDKTLEPLGKVFDGQLARQIGCRHFSGLLV